MVLLIVGFAWLSTPSPPWLDDAYISLDSAQSLLSGGDRQYGTPPLTGVTSPPYVLLLSIPLGLGLEPLLALKLASAMGLAALALAVWALAGSVGLDGWRRYALPVAVLTAGPVVEQATNGVETGWAMATATALVAASVARRPIATALAAGLLPWLRPDLLPLAGLALLAAIWKQAPAVRVRAVAVAAAIFAPWSLWVYLDTGHWIPQTMGAKAAFFAEACHPLPTKFATAGRALLEWFIALQPGGLLAAMWIFRSSMGRLALVAAVITIGAYVTLLPGGLFHNYHRYLYPIGVPLLALGFAESLTRRAFVWRAATIAVIAASLLLVPTKRLPVSGHAEERLAAAAWVRQHVDARATLLVQDAGVFSVFTTHPLVDLVGLKTPSSAAVHQALTQPSCGAARPEAITAIARSSGAAYLIVSSEWDLIFSLTAGLKEQGIGLELLRFPPGSPDGYHVYRMTFEG